MELHLDISTEELDFGSFFVCLLWPLVITWGHSLECRKTTGPFGISVFEMYFAPVRVFPTKKMISAVN